MLTHSFVIVSTLITLHQKLHLKCCPEFLHCLLLNLLQPNPSCLPKESSSWALQGLCKKLLQPFPCISEGQHQNQELSVCTRNFLATCRARCLPGPLLTPAPWVLQMSYSLYPAASCLALSHIPNPFCTPAQAHSAAPSLGVSHPRAKRPFCASQEKGELLVAFPSSWAEDSPHLAMRGLSLGANEQMFGTLPNTSISQEISNLL